MKTGFLIVSIIILFFSQKTIAQNGAWISHSPPIPIGGTWYSDAGGNCVGTVPASSQYIFFYDNNAAAWTEVSLDTIHNFWGLDACGNVIIAYSDEMVVGYSSITSSWDTISYQGTPLSPTQNAIHRSWGCSTNLAYFVTDTEYFVFDGVLGLWQSLSVTMPPSFYGVGFFWAEEDYCGVVLNVSAPDHDKNLMYSLHTHSFNQIDNGGDYNHNNSKSHHGFVAVYTNGTDNTLYGYTAITNSVSTITINGHYIYGGNDRSIPDKSTVNTSTTFGYNIVNSPSSRTAYMKGYDTRTGIWTEDSYTYDPTISYGITDWINGGQFSAASNVHHGSNRTTFIFYKGETGEFLIKPTELTSTSGYIIGGSVFAAADIDSIYFYSIETDTSQTVPRRWQSPVWYPGDNYFLIGTYDSGVSDSMDLYIYHGPSNQANHYTTWRTNQIYGTSYFCAFATVGSNNKAIVYSSILDTLLSYTFPAGSTPGFYPNEKMLIIIATDNTVTFHAETGFIIDKPYILGGLPGKNAFLGKNGSFDMEGYSAYTGTWSSYTLTEHILNCHTEDLVGLTHCRDGATWTDRYFAYNGFSDNIVYLNPSGISVLYSDKVGDETILIVRDSTMYAFDPFGISDIDEQSEIITPQKYHLSQNYPNPFNPSTTINFSIPKAEFVTLKIFNALGQEVTTLVSNKLSSGSHKYIWDASDLASGIYYYKLEAGEYTQTRKLVLIK